MNTFDIVKYFYNKFGTPIKKVSENKTEIICIMKEEYANTLHQFINGERLVFGIIISPNDIINIYYVFINDYSSDKYNKIKLTLTHFENKTLFCFYKKNGQHINDSGRSIINMMNIFNNEKEISEINDEILIFILENNHHKDELYNNPNFNQITLNNFGLLIYIIQQLIDNPKSISIGLSIERFVYIQEQKKNLIILYNNDLSKIIFMIIKENETQIIKDLTKLPNELSLIIYKFFSCVNYYYYIYFDKKFGLVVIKFDKNSINYDLYYFVDIKNDSIFFICDHIISFNLRVFKEILKEYICKFKDIFQLKRVKKIKCFIQFLESKKYPLEKIKYEGYTISQDGIFSKIHIKDSINKNFFYYPKYDIIDTRVNYFSSFLNYFTDIKKNRNCLVFIYQNKQFITKGLIKIRKSLQDNVL
jgi:hypothetical protein